MHEDGTDNVQRPPFGEEKRAERQHLWHCLPWGVSMHSIYPLPTSLMSEVSLTRLATGDGYLAKDGALWRCSTPAIGRCRSVISAPLRKTLGAFLHFSSSPPPEDEDNC
ncbi:hypothetical protein PMIN03_000764 [Paraphaeosphaeria minitans]